MITYLYWIGVLGLTGIILFGLGAKADKWKAAAIGSVIVLVVGWGAYNFHFRQIFVKRYGGVMQISVPNGQKHIGCTWKGDHLWIESYDPKTNKCIFTEYSKGNVLQGKVIIKDCNPLLPSQRYSYK